MSTPPFLALPSSVERVEVTTPRGTFATLAARPRDGHRAGVFLVPGFTGSKEDFIAVLAPCADAGHPVIAVDLRGQNETAAAGDASAYSLDEFAADIHAVIQATTSSPAHVLGHSFGGLVARNLTLAQPDAVRSLTLLCSGPGALPEYHHARTRLFGAALQQYGPQGLWRALQALERAEGNFGPDDPAVAQFLVDRFMRHDPTCLVEMTRVLVEDLQRVGELAATRVPVHVVAGEADGWWSPQEQKQMAHDLGGSFTLIPDAAHSPNVEQPALTVAAVTSFWAQCER